LEVDFQGVVAGAAAQVVVGARMMAAPMAPRVEDQELAEKASP